MAGKVRVLYFARAREVTGKSEEEFELQEKPGVEWLVSLLQAQYSGMAGLLKEGTLAVNEAYIDKCEDVVLKSGDTVAVIPPISGG